MHANDHWLERRGNLDRLLRVFYVICAVLLAADLVWPRHAQHAPEGLAGFFAVYGFVACVVLVLAATWLRKLLMRPPDYYDRD